MAKKPMNHNELKVGRYYPKDPKYLDIIMSVFCKSDGSFTDSFPPDESYLKPAFKQARRNGWLKATSFQISFQGSKPDRLWELTETGKIAAKEARERYDSIKAAQKLWGEDWLKIYRESQNSQKTT